MKKITIAIQEWLYVMMGMMMLVGATIFPNYATDTFVTFENPSSAVLHMLKDNGRPVTALIYKCMAVLGITDVNTIWVYTILGFACLYLSIVLYEDSLREYIKNDLTRCIVGTLAICNIYIVEFFMFLEKVSFLLAILFCVMSYRGMKRIIEDECENKKLEFVLSMVGLILAACTYQSTMALFIALLLPIVMRMQYKWVEKIKWLFISALMYGGAGIVNLVVLRIVGSARVDSEYSILDRLKMFITLPRVCIGTFGIVPKFFWVFTVIVLASLCVAVTRRKDRKNIIIHLLLVSIGTEVCALSTFILGVGYLIPRVIYVIASLPMLIIVFAFVNGSFEDDFQNDYSRINKAVLGIITINLIVTSIGLNHIYKDKYITNTLDEYRCYMIGQAIESYEESTGITVENIVYYDDLHPDGYEGLFSTHPMFRTSSFETQWSEVRAVGYYLGRHFERGKAKEAIAKAFIEKDWNVFSEDQLIFDGDTLHICRY